MSVRADVEFLTIELSDPTYEVEGLRHATVGSPALHRRGDVSLFVPPEAVDMTDIPVFILMHGVYGSHWAWAMKAGAHRIAARMISDGRLQPCVLAMPSDGLWGQGSGYIPHADHDPERWILDEVPAIAALACNAITAKSPVCIIGLSMGGFGAMHLGGKFPDRFRAIAAHSSCTNIAQLAEFTTDDRTGCSTAATDIDAFAALQSAGSALPSLAIDCGTEDPLLDYNRILHAELTKAGIAHHYAEYPGGHEWSYWTARLPETFRFFEACCAAPARKR
jgi:putative tributyrin esterase